ncbi:MAG: DUF6883 domain-containing protein [Prochlorotrichaceae cyanobacterium]|jgi:hypothetical protein
MKIPNSDRVLIDLDKLAGYSLNQDHDRGKHKARLFASVLGMTSKDVLELAEILREAIQTKDAILGQNNEYGQRYIIDFQLSRLNAVALVRSCWIIRPNEDFPRLTSCYILRSLS